MTNSNGKSVVNDARMSMMRSALPVLGAALVASLALPQPAEARKHREQHVSEKRERAREEKRAPTIPPGQLHIVIALSTQRVAVYSDGVLATRSGVATGVPGHPTPTGVFSVIGKERYHASNIYSGAPMPFMQRITWSGVALHLGVVPGGRPASHGCIRLNSDFAQLMWNATKIGARVIISQNEVVPSEFTQAFPFTPKPKPVLSDSATPPPAVTRTAEAAPAIATDAAPAALPEPDNLTKDLDGQEAKKEMAQPGGPISVFASLKEKRLFIRQAFLPIYEIPLTIRDADRPIGTHVFTAVATPDPAKLRWLVVTVPDNPKPTSEKPARKDAKPADVEKPSNAAEALERLDIPADARARIEDMLTAGASFIVSDRGLGEETGEGTDFVILTR